MSRRRFCGFLLLFTAVQVTLALLFACLLPREEPEPADIVIIRTTYGEITGVGRVTDPEEAAYILDAVDHLEYVGVTNPSMGGTGIQLLIFQGDGVRRYLVKSGHEIKDYQDPTVGAWYYHDPPDLRFRLEALLQAEYPSPYDF